MRTVLSLGLALGLFSVSAHGETPAPRCEPTPSHHAVRIVGDDQRLPSVAGDQNFYQALDNGWVFALVRAEEGWSVRVYEGEPVGDAVDLTSMTPPLRGAPNPRDIYGWHFRNKDNTEPNEGDVNAPQNLRAFVISPNLAGTGGFRLSGNTAPDLSPNDGIGWLNIIDFGLSNPEPGGRASMNYLQFDACLSWPRSADERDQLLDAASTEFTPEDLEIYGTCGLDLDRYSLAAPFAPRQLSGDFDGDTAHDLITRVKRNRDGRLGLATCRAGTWTEIFGFEDFEDLKGGYVDQMESWTVFIPGVATPRQLKGYELPEVDRPLILLERIEKEGILLFWRNGAWRAEKIYGQPTE